MNHEVIFHLREALSKRLTGIGNEFYMPDPEQNSPLPNYEITSLTFADDDAINEMHGDINAEITFRGVQNFYELEKMVAAAFAAITQADNPNIPYIKLELPEPFRVRNQRGGGVSESRTASEYEVILGMIFSITENTGGCI